MPAAAPSRGPGLVRGPAVAGAAARTIRLLAVWCVVAANAAPARAQAVGGPADVAAVRAASRAYRDALATGNVAAVRAAWTADGDAVDYHQRIGWDPVVRRIRSWSFASDGSRGEATWFRDGDSWVIVQTGILPDGRQEAVVNIYTYDGGDRFVWRVLPQALESDEDLPTRATWVRTRKGENR